MTDARSRLDALLRNPLYGVPFAQLRDRHRPIAVDTGVWRSKGSHPQHCRTCGTLWPCEVGTALEIIGWLLGM